MDSQIAFIHMLQADLPGQQAFFQAVAFLGLPEFYLLVIPLIIWCFNRSLGVRLVILLSISGAVSDALKLWFHSPRPYWISTKVSAYSSYPSFGFPSTHAQNAVGFFGLIAATLRRWWIWIACTLIILLIGLARVYQAVHFPSDIIGGYCAGLLLLVLFLKFEKPVGLWMHKTPLHVRIGFSFAASCTFILFSLLALASLGSWQLPPEWSSLAFAQTGVSIDPLFPVDTLVSAGLLFGSAAGAAISDEYIRYEADGRWSQKAGRYIVGIIILFTIWILLGPAATLPGITGDLLQYIRPALAGLWITCGAPALFQRIGLFNEEPVEYVREIR
jgi:Membrane-associated phospholipid phosphatase